MFNCKKFLGFATIALIVSILMTSCNDGETAVEKKPTAADSAAISPMTQLDTIKPDTLPVQKP